VAAFTSSFCSPPDFKSTFDYYPVFRATAKIDFTGALVVRGETYREWLFRLQGRQKLHCSYAGELRVLTPPDQRCEYFVEDYHSRHERRIGKMSRQSRVIGVDYAANFKNHPRVFSFDHSR
jgi:hypothetical protein